MFSLYPTAIARGLSLKSRLSSLSKPIMIDSASGELMLWSTIRFTILRVERILDGDIPGTILLRISYTASKLSV